MVAVRRERRDQRLELGLLDEAARGDDERDLGGAAGRLRPTPAPVEKLSIAGTRPLGLQREERDERRARRRQQHADALARARPRGQHARRARSWR